MQIAVSRSLDDLADFWPDLGQCGDFRAYAFQTREPLRIWLETIGAARGTEPYFVSVKRDDGRPLLLIPLGIERRHGVRVLAFLDGGVSDYNAPVLFDGAECTCRATVERMWSEIVARLPRPDVAILEKIPANVKEWRNPLQVLTGAPDLNSGHLLHLDHGEMGPEGEYKPVRLRDVNRKRRKLEQIAKVRLWIAATPEENRLVHDEMVRQKTRRYVETRGVDGFDRPGYRAYYRTMTERLSPSGRVQLSALMADDTMIAAHWGIVTAHRFYSLMPTFEAGDWARYSPGTLHLEALIAWCRHQGISTFDLGVGDEPYKERVENAKLALYVGRHAFTAKGRAYLAALDVRRRLAATPIGDAWRTYKRRRLPGTVTEEAPQQARDRS